MFTWMLGMQDIAIAMQTFFFYFGKTCAIHRVISLHHTVCTLIFSPSDFRSELRLEPRSVYAFLVVSLDKKLHSKLPPYPK